ncbi:MAG TPA: hypothetical protein VIN39_09375 [Candidatus Dormibacteraeota bacterium]
MDASRSLLVKAIARLMDGQRAVAAATAVIGGVAIARACFPGAATALEPLACNTIPATPPSRTPATSTVFRLMSISLHEQRTAWRNGYATAAVCRRS